LNFFGTAGALRFIFEAWSLRWIPIDWNLESHSTLEETFDTQLPTCFPPDVTLLRILLVAVVETDDNRDGVIVLAGFAAIAV